MASIVLITKEDLPPDILTGTYQFQSNNSWTTLGWLPFIGNNLEFVTTVYNNTRPDRLFRGRIADPAELDHATIMTPDVWWDVEGVYRQVEGYSPDTQKYHFSDKIRVRKNWFTGKTSVVQPPE